MEKNNYIWQKLFLPNIILFLGESEKKKCFGFSIEDPVYNDLKRGERFIAVGFGESGDFV